MATTDIETPISNGTTDNNQRSNENAASSAGYLVYKKSKKPEKQDVVGPDGKAYTFSSSISKERIDKYFTKQGWVKGKDGRWLTASGESVDRKTPSDVPAITPSKSGRGMGVDMVDTSKLKKDSAATDYVGQSLPSIGGAIGGTIGRTPGAAFGGAVGEGLKLVTRSIMLNEDIGNKKAAQDMAIEALKQAGLQKVGDVGGEMFFKAISKIPHAVIRNGIKLLPSELGQGGKVSRYIEDLLGNLIPSAKVMENFKAEQSAEVINKINTFAQGMAKFSGTPEEMGIAVQQALKDGRASAEKSMDALRKGYAKKGYTPAQAEAYLSRTKVYKNWVETYENQLSKAIVATNKPELIAGLLTSSKAALSETRLLNETLKELAPETLGKVQNVIMRDVLQQTLTGSKDPVAKGAAAVTGKFAGDKFKAALDRIGENKLKAIYGEQGFKNIEEFTKQTALIGRNANGGGVGKFMNLMFLLPFRTGISGGSVAKLGGTAFIMNRAAKMITSTEGVELTNQYVRATISNSPRLINLAAEEIKKYNQRSDEEFERDEKAGEQQYLDEHKEKK